ncbi:MAG: murein biosynthesis integral membrane protein MurJ [Chloroflexi bacterium]|nr:murein biosynthesis integral membrane protein MurJ [Chloroflexota bacterium]
MRKPSLASAALIIAASYVVSNLAGFVARALINARFGTSIEQDAFRLAFNIPDLLFNLLAGGALASAFIPTYTGRLAAGEGTLARRLALRVMLLTTLGIGLIAALAALTAPALVDAFIAPGLPANGRALTAELMRIMLLSTLIFSVSGLCMGILQSNGNFLAPAIAPVLYNGGQILGAAALAARFGAHGLAWGVVIGALAHLLVQIPAVLRILRTPITNDASNISSDLRYILRAMPLRMIGSGAVYVNNIVRDNLASRVSAGAVSALNSAFATMILPQAVIAQAIGAALFPTISAHAARGERDEFARTLTRAINIVIALAVPATAGLLVLGKPLIALLFQRGRFDAQSTQAVGLALAMSGLGLVGHCVLELVTRAFYALKDNRPPMLLGLASVALNIALSLLLLPLASRWIHMPYVALALSNAIATTVETAVLYVMLTRRTPAIRFGDALRETARSLVAATGMALTALGTLHGLGGGALATLAALATAAVAYLALAFILRSELVTFVRRQESQKE